MISTVQAVAGKPVVLSGYAQNFACPIVAVQFSGDGGATWTTYETPVASKDCNVNWQFEFTPTRAGRCRLLVRAMDGKGNVTPEPAFVPLVVAEGEAVEAR